MALFSWVFSGAWGSRGDRPQIHRIRQQNLTYAFHAGRGRDAFVELRGEFMLRATVLVLAALMLCACTQGYVYMRADGRDFGEDPALYQQFETDRMTCQGVAHGNDIPSNATIHSTGAMGDNGRDCMAGKGYLVVQSDVAELKRKEIVAQAAEKAEREAAAAAPPPPPPAPPKRVAAKPKPKPHAQPTPQPAQAQTAPPAANWPAPQSGQARSAPAAPNWPAPQTPPG
jgi:hypothetical protein